MAFCCITRKTIFSAIDHRQISLFRFHSDITKRAVEHVCQRFLFCYGRFLVTDKLGSDMENKVAMLTLYKNKNQ